MNKILRYTLTVICSLYGVTYSAFSQGFVTVEIGSSPNPVGSGARALGQGNAFIAVADDATAASWNPGGLTQLERPEFSFALDTRRRYERTESSDAPEIGSSDALSLDALNYASFVLPIYYGRHMVLSLNYLKVYGFEKQLGTSRALFGDPTDQTDFDIFYDLEFDQEGQFSVLAPAFAIDITPKFSLGVTLNFWNQSSVVPSAYTKDTIVSGRALSNFQFLIDALGRRGEAQFYQTQKDSFAISSGSSVTIGSMYRYSKEWAFGAVVKPRYAVDIDHVNEFAYVQGGDLGIAMNPGPDGVDGTGDDIPTPGPDGVVGTADDVPRLSSFEDQFELEFPWIIGAGFAWRPSDPLTVSMDITWTDWSAYVLKDHAKGEVRNPITGDGINSEIRTKPRHKTRLDDTITARIGCEYLFIFEELLMPVRFGMGYDPSPAIDSTDHFYTLNAGWGMQIQNRINLDFGYEFRWGNNVGSDSLDFGQGVRVVQDVRRHRFMTSMIVYF